jgi:hypothetical protein
MKMWLNKEKESLKKKKKELKRNAGNKKFLKSNKKYSSKPLQQTGTSGLQNFRAERQSIY